MALRTVAFSCARLKEIENIQALLETQNATKLAFQKLPRHMRRRMMGHTTKRIPQRIRQIHTNQLLKSGLPPKKKRPSRKFRRRPKLLNDEKVRRQRKIKWLETHIWHAKRFHMKEKWSYKIPYQPTDKAFRACYRAACKHCLLQDISYTGCLELRGNQEILINCFKSMTKSNEGLSMHAKAYINGNREGRAMMYKPGGGPAIGRITYNWMPASETNEVVIWIWAHASFYDELMEEFKCLDCENSQVEINDLRFDLSRFRLTGPLSQAVLNKALKPVNASLPIDNWLQTFLEKDEQRQMFSDQIDYWNSIRELNSPALLSPHTIFSVIVIDPRYNMPNKRTKAINYNHSHANILPPNKLSAGAMWDGKIRKVVAKSKKSNAMINELRSNLLVPGSTLNDQGAAVPLMLIQRPGIDKTGFCSGWDVIIPKMWAQPLWLCLIMWGARAGGYREAEKANFECVKEPILPLDSAAGMKEESQLDETNRKRYFSLPPNKRINYNKFSIVSPFCCNWKVLLNDWDFLSTETFTILRNKELLSTLQTHLKKRGKINTTIENCLVPVKLVPLKGNISRYSIICLPHNDDLKKHATIMEPKKADPFKDERKRLRQEHKILLHKLKKKRHMTRKKSGRVVVDKSIVTTFLETMRNLWLPEVKTGIRTSAAREVMGFIVQGGESYATGRCQGIGYIPLTALHHFLSTCIGNKILYRNTNDRLYRTATLEIIQ